MTSIRRPTGPKVDRHRKPSIRETRTRASIARTTILALVSLIFRPDMSLIQWFEVAIGYQ